MNVRVVASALLVAAVLAGGYLTRAHDLRTAASFDAVLPSDVSQIPARTHCAKWYLDSVVDATAGRTLTPLPARRMTIRRGHVLELKGWAFIAGAHDYARALYWNWDGGSDRIVFYPLKREDVAQKNANAAALFSGFYATLDTRGEPHGTHVLGFRILDHDGRSACTSRNVLAVNLR